jgi:hypothetical protein
MNNRSIKNHITKNCTSYVPVYPEKYSGRPPIICRSSWEDAFCRWADHSKGIKSWVSEEIPIKYQDPINPIKNNKPHFKTYWPDFVIETVNGEIYLIEVKPYKDTLVPKNSTKKARKTILTEQKNYRVNQAKWQAARAYCYRKGWTFKIITEKELFGKR